MKLKEMFSTFSNTLNEHKPEIATGVGLAFMFGGTAVAVIATVKTMKALEKEKDEKLQEICPDGNFDELTVEEKQAYDDTLMARPSVKDVARVGWKWWILPAGLLAAGTGSILYSDKEQAKRIAGLMAKAGALAFQVAESKDYREAAREILGEEKEKEIDDRAAKKNVHRRTKSEDDIYDTGTGKELFVDYYSGRRFRASMLYLERCLMDLNKELWRRQKNDYLEKYITLNDWYDILQIPHNDGLGEEFGFDVDDYEDSDEIRFDLSNSNSFKDDNLESNWIVKFSSSTNPKYIPRKL